MSNRAAFASIRDNLLKVTTPNSRLGRFEFENLVVFDDTRVSGLPLVKERHEGKCKVLDWFNVRSGMEHDHQIFETQSDFVKTVHFYPSDRFGIQKAGRIRKDLVAVSHLSRQEINNFDYSDTLARFKILDMMKKAGIRGARNGRDTYNPNIYRYYSVKIEPTERQIIPKVETFYEDDDRFEFRYDTPEEILKNYKNDMQNYTSKINNVLFSKISEDYL